MKETVHPLCPRLKPRLDGGFGALSNTGRAAPNLERNDAIAFERLCHHYEPLESSIGSPSGWESASKTFTKDLTQRPEIVRALLHRPSDALTSVESWHIGKPVDDTRRWWVFTASVELLWQYLNSTTPEASDHQHLMPLAARSRFIALSEPFRSLNHPVWNETVINNLFGKVNQESRVEFIQRARSARDVWRHQLAGFQDFGQFNGADPAAVDEELQMLAFADGKSTPLQLIDPGQPASEDPNSQAIIEDVIERHLLPRFALWRVWRTVLIRSSTNKLGPYLLYILIALSTIASGVLAALQWNFWAENTPVAPSAIAAAATYVVIGVGTLRFGRLWAMPLLLRQPAAAAFGLVALVALPVLLENSVSYWRELSALFIIASFGYLLIECRNHNPGQLTEPIWRTISRLVGRPLAVLWIGIVHSFLVTSIGLATIIPAATTSNSELRRLLTAGTTSEQLAILLVATLWCLTVGVFSQILWQDQPITAPLAHRRWRSER